MTDIPVAQQHLSSIPGKCDVKAEAVNRNVFQHRSVAQVASGTQGQSFTGLVLPKTRIDMS